MLTRPNHGVNRSGDSTEPEIEVNRRRPVNLTVLWLRRFSPNEWKIDWQNHLNSSLLAARMGRAKTTLAIEYADELALPYIGADAIAAALNPSNPAAAQTAAARKFIRSIEEHISQQKSFVCESTLSGLTMRNFVASAREAGYAISIAFLFVDSADVCVARVAERVRAGGHNVPEPDIRRRFERSIRNFWTIYRELADNWVLLYNGLTTLRDIAVGAGTRTAVRDSEVFSAFLAHAGELQ